VIHPRLEVPPNVLPEGASQRLGFLVTDLRRFGELVVNEGLSSGIAEVEIRRPDGTLAARASYDRETVDLLGECWAEHAAAALRAILEPVREFRTT
jgi:hypothetical protein